MLDFMLEMFLILSGLNAASDPGGGGPAPQPPQDPGGPGPN